VIYSLACTGAPFLARRPRFETAKEMEGRPTTSSSPPYAASLATQFLALLRKSSSVLLFRWSSSASAVLLPALFVLALHALWTSLVSTDSAPLPVPRFTACTAFNVYGRVDEDASCATLLYAPAGDPFVDAVLTRVARATGLGLGTDIVGVADAAAASSALFDATSAASAVDTAVIFNTTAFTSPPNPLGDVAYEIWYNDTSVQAYAKAGLDELWRTTGTSGRFAALQTALDASITLEVLQRASGAPVVEADGQPTLGVTLGAFREYTVPGSAGSSGGGGTIMLLLAGGTFLLCGGIVGALLLASIVSSEKARGLADQLRTIGMIESAHWGAWVVAVLPVLVAAAALVPAVGSQTAVPLFLQVEFRVHFVAALLMLLAVTANALCCGACLSRRVFLNLAAFLQFASAVAICISFSALGLYSLAYSPSMPLVLPLFLGLFPAFHYGRLINTITTKVLYPDQGGGSGGGGVGVGSGVGAGPFAIEEETLNLVRLRVSPTHADVLHALGVGVDGLETLHSYARGGMNVTVSAASPTPPTSSTPPSPLGAGAASGDTGFGVFTWADLFNPPSPSTVYVGGLPQTFVDREPAWDLAMLGAVASGYLFLCWYLSQVSAGEPVYFIVSPYYWGLVSPPSVAEIGDTITALQAASAREGSVRIHKLSKSYARGGGAQALKEVSLTLPAGQLTAMLGQNGAGKTTLVKVISGLVLPTHGEAFLFGKSVRSEMSALRSVIGSCPQDDVLWEELSARAHVELYARFRGVAAADFRRHVDDRLASVSLLDVAKGHVTTFSGGMKRRLSVALAAVGDPRIIFLDEPTTGLDPLSRRKVWSMIDTLKRGRVLVLTTHSMEEADALGDQVAILATGRLRAVGTPLFLKNRFGAGWQLNLLADAARVGELKALVRAHLPTAEIIGEESSGTSGTSGASFDSPLAPAPDAAAAAAAAAAAGLLASRAASGVVTVSVSRRETAAIPPFLRVLEAYSASRKLADEVTPGGGGAGEGAEGGGKGLVKEWGIGGSTLEEVFLRLAAANTEVNARVGMAGPSDGPPTAYEGMAPAEPRQAWGGLAAAPSAPPASNNMCLLCGSAPPAPSPLFTSHAVRVVVTNAICASCAVRPPEAIAAVRADAVARGLLPLGSPPLPFLLPAGPSRTAATAAAAAAAAAAESSLVDSDPTAAAPGTAEVLDDEEGASSSAGADVYSSRPPKGVTAVTNPFHAKAALAASAAMRTGFQATPVGGAAGGGTVVLNPLAAGPGPQREMDAARRARIRALGSISSSVGAGVAAPPPPAPSAPSDFAPPSPVILKRRGDEDYMAPVSFMEQFDAVFILRARLNCTKAGVAGMLFSLVGVALMVLLGAASAPTSLVRCPGGYYADNATNLCSREGYAAWMTGATARTPVRPVYAPAAPAEVDEQAAAAAAAAAAPPPYANIFYAQVCPTHDASGSCTVPPPFPVGPDPLELSFASAFYSSGRAPYGTVLSYADPTGPGDVPLAGYDLFGQGIGNLTFPFEFSALPSPTGDVNADVYAAQQTVAANSLRMNGTCSSYGTFSGPGRGRVGWVFPSQNAAADWVLQNFPSIGLELGRSRPDDPAPTLSYSLFHWALYTDSTHTLYRPSRSTRYTWTDIYSTDRIYCNQASVYSRSDAPWSRYSYPNANGAPGLAAVSLVDSAFLRTVLARRGLTGSPVPGTAGAQNVSANPMIRTSYALMPAISWFAAVGGAQMGGFAFQALLWPLFTLTQIAAVAYGIAHEKREKLWAVMTMAGLRRGPYFAASYVFAAMNVLLVGLIFYVAGLLAGVASIQNASWTVFAALIACGAHSVAGVGLFLGTVLRSPRGASIVGYLLILLVAVGNFLVTQFVDPWPEAMTWVPLIAYARAATLVLLYGGASVVESPDLQSALGACLLHGCAGVLLAFYFHAVLPAPEATGMTRSPFFPCIDAVRGALRLVRRRKRGTAGEWAGTLSTTTTTTTTTAAAASSPAHHPSSSPATLNALMSDPDVDPDVTAERRRAASGGEAAIIVRGLIKEYPAREGANPIAAALAAALGGGRGSGKGLAAAGKAYRAVDGLHLRVPYGETLGLLGPNGAGKTTTISMLTGHTEITSGLAAVGGYDADEQLDNVWRVLGVAPQFDVVWDDLSVAAHLNFFARVKGCATAGGGGIGRRGPSSASHSLSSVLSHLAVAFGCGSSSHIRAIVQNVAERVELDGDAFRQPAKALSGGMRRRLSIGIALTGSPRVVLLDEPTTGLDPETRRHVHKIIAAQASPTRAMVITTHSMEEADALCSRIAIMARGKLRAVGTQLHLKRRYGDGYRVALTLAGPASAAAPGALEALEAAAHAAHAYIVSHVHPSARLVSRVGASATYLLPREEEGQGSAGGGGGGGMGEGAGLPTAASSFSSPSAAVPLDVASVLASLEAAKRLSPPLIVEFGLSQASLEDVFVRVVEDADGQAEREKDAAAAAAVVNFA
jgi:ABC-type multidrug transport system ATPase subunit